MRNVLPAALLAAALLCLGGANGEAAEPSADLAIVRMTPQTGFLKPDERRVANLLIQAADAMNPIYARQHAGKGPGYGFYPDGMTKAAFEAYLAAHPEQKPELTGGLSVVRRQGQRLIAVPYSVEYRAELEKAAALLERAAAITGNASLKRFLTLRAAAFRSNDYFASDMAWMDVTGTPIEMVIGPYETYGDELYGQKAAFEAYLVLKDPAESRRLEHYKRRLRDMEANLPVEDRFKNFKRGGASPITVGEQVHGGGENVDGGQAIAFNLPNDERVREAKGAKKVILTNVLSAKYGRILQPIAARVLVREQAPLLRREYFVFETLFHELSHSLGPGSIVLNGRPTTVEAEMKEIHSTSEEAKADVMGIYNILYMMKLGEIPAADRPQLMATYLAGVFRSVRFGEDEAHGRGAALQYGYLKAKGGFSYDARQKRFRVNDQAMAAGLRDLVADIVRLQATGDHDGMVALFDRYAHLDPDARRVIATLKDVPVDIATVYPERI